MRKRRTARVMLFDESGEVLLIRFVVPREDGEFVFWALPGGEIEAGETETEAAAREVREELGLDLVMTGPVYCDRNQFLHQGEMQDNTDFLFRAKCRREEPQLMGVTADEREIMRESRWWSEDEIANSKERIFPKNLAERMREQIGRSGLDRA
ncbi:NUDIX domain-containing protein [Tunturiibacter gelidoferens]|uniref:ADP-ribose pyrophosphatase YjhB (NUDIX family) n=1 Tax=Tunturiibacter gelidiferens TaxID=3069689 RepID=A0ACC5NZ89_9BACT|nr:ADP-ribose pyrophosphatase YjhB (NUDIX family) [Edaphobacter lichenicola]